MNPTNILLYAIADPSLMKGRDLVSCAVQAALGGATIFQYRDKTSDTRTLVENAKALKSALAEFNVPLLINDRVDVALAAHADGVHLGQSDMHVDQARALLGDDAIIGLTIKEATHVENAPVELIDYACIGGVYDTLSKDNPVAIGVDGWRELAGSLRARKADLPIGAIAGIEADNLAQLLAAGVDGVAVISAIFMADDIAGATSQMYELMKGQAK